MIGFSRLAREVLKLAGNEAGGSGMTADLMVRTCRKNHCSSGRSERGGLLGTISPVARSPKFGANLQILHRVGSYALLSLFPASGILKAAGRSPRLQRMSCASRSCWWSDCLSRDIALTKGVHL